MVRARRGGINQLAVAEVLARHLWSYPRGHGDADVLPHQLKDTVSRALSGKLLSRPTLALFIDAFGISAPRPTGCWRLWKGSGSVSGAVRPPGGDAAGPRSDLRAVLGPRRHQTLSLHDHVHVGRRRPARPGQHPAGHRGDGAEHRPDPVPVRHEAR